MNRRLRASLIGAGLAACIGWSGCTTDVVDLEKGPDGSLVPDNCSITLEKEFTRTLTCTDPVKVDYTYNEDLWCSETLDGGVNCKRCKWGKNEEQCQACWTADKTLASSTCHQNLP